MLERVLPKRKGSSLFDPEKIAGRDLKELRRELDRTYLARLFTDTQGDLDRMAAELGVKVSNLYHWFRRVDLDIKQLRRGV